MQKSELRIEHFLSPPRGIGRKIDWHQSCKEVLDKTPVREREKQPTNTPMSMNNYQDQIDTLQPYSLDALSLAPICQKNCSQYWIDGTVFLLPIFLNVGCVPGDVVETVELEFLELLLSGLTAVLLDDEDNVRRVRYNADWELEIDGLVYNRYEEISQMGTRRLVRWE